MKRIIGVDYLHELKLVQEAHEIPEDYVVVDRKDWEEVVQRIKDEEELEAKIKMAEEFFNDCITDGNVDMDKVKDFTPSDEKMKSLFEEFLGVGRSVDEAIKTSIPPNPDKNVPENPEVTKSKALGLMRQGIKMTHHLFTPEEWITIEGDKIKTEEGYLMPQREFWGYRKEGVWDTGWKVWIE